MRKIQVVISPGFHVIAEARRSQAATMEIAPGEAEGGPNNKHRADQWLYVLDGSGEAIIEGKKVELEAGTLVEIEAGETHEIRNTGKAELKTLNFYAPPEY